MGLFVGSYDNAIDKKGRVSLPAPFRAALGEPVKSIFIFPSVDAKGECLIIWSIAAMTRIAKMKRDYKDMTGPEHNVARLAVRAGRQIAVDENGRLQLPADMIASLGISDIVTFAGDGLYCSAWEPVRFKRDMEELMSGRIEGGNEVLMGLVSDGGEAQ